VQIDVKRFIYVVSEARSNAAWLCCTEKKVLLHQLKHLFNKIFFVTATK